LSKIYYKPSIEGEELTDEFKEELRQNLPALSMVLEEQSLIIPGESNVTKFPCHSFLQLIYSIFIDWRTL
jgi:hypothetical protein